MIIRLADVENEAEQIIFGVRDFVSRMDFKDFLTMEMDDFEKYVIALLSSDNFEVIVAEENGVIVSGIGIVYAPFLWNPGILTAEELFWWSSPDAPPRAALYVLRDALKRAKGNGEVGKTLVAFKSLKSSPDGVGRIYEKFGMQEVETNYLGVF